MNDRTSIIKHALLLELVTCLNAIIVNLEIMKQIVNANLKKNFLIKKQVL